MIDPRKPETISELAAQLTAINRIRLENMQLHTVVNNILAARKQGLLPLVDAIDAAETLLTRLSKPE